MKCILATWGWTREEKSRQIPIIQTEGCGVAGGKEARERGTMWRAQAVPPA